MKQVIVKKSASGAALQTAPANEPVPDAGQCVVRVDSFSLNRGEVTAALQRAEDGWAPGWDFAGTVIRAAAGEAGPPVGARVVGLKTSGAWAQTIAVDTRNLAVLPDTIGFETASTLPVAGLTALYALEKSPALLGKEVLITGASGGLGQFAIQLALLAGASVTAVVHRNSVAAPARASAERFRVIRADDAGLAQLAQRRYDLIIESVGGAVFSAAADAIAFGGTLVALGGTSSSNGSFDIRRFFNVGRAQIYGFNIFDELSDKPASGGLARLIRLVQDGMLVAPVTYRGTVAELDRVARELLDSKIPGKAVLRWVA